MSDRMITSGTDPTDPEHVAWHQRHALFDPDGLVATFWTRLEQLSAADATQILLATRDLNPAHLIAARQAALDILDSTSVAFEGDEFRLRETLKVFVLREPGVGLDAINRRILYGALRDALLAFAAVQTKASLSRAEYAVLSDAWWAGAN